MNELPIDTNYTHEQGERDNHDKWKIRKGKKLTLRILQTKRFQKPLIGLTKQVRKGNSSTIQILHTMQIDQMNRRFLTCLKMKRRHRTFTMYSKQKIISIKQTPQKTQTIETTMINLKYITTMVQRIYSSMKLRIMKMTKKCKV